jgi:hypothetical protein
MIRGRKSSWEGEQWIIAQEKGGSEGSKRRGKKIVMVKLIIQKKKKTKYRNNKKFSLLGKSSLSYSFGVQSWYWCLVFWALWGRVLLPFSDSLG